MGMIMLEKAAMALICEVLHYELGTPGPGKYWGNRSVKIREEGHHQISWDFRVDKIAFDYVYLNDATRTYIRFYNDTPKGHAFLTIKNDERDFNEIHLEERYGNYFKGSEYRGTHFEITVHSRNRVEVRDDEDGHITFFELIY